MQKWEYLYVLFKYDLDKDKFFYEIGEQRFAHETPNDASVFNRIGDDGWELVLRSPDEFIFKRPKS